MVITRKRLKQIIYEELTKSDKDEVKRMISKELKSMVEDEVEKVLKSKSVKDDIGDITKSVLKKLYKDLSIQHPYIIDRIKI
jgi:hypothetical protein|tara:strand:+ start:32 stop:277 length:246 start_codon:yes stop_codon:yes gene_type:complete